MIQATPQMWIRVAVKPEDFRKGIIPMRGNK